MGIVYIESHEELARMQKEFEKGVKKDEPKIKKEIADILAKKVYEDTVKACNEIINSWYASYSPLFYKDRLFSLRNAVKVTLEGTCIRIYGESDALGGHRLNSEGLYDLTMEQGYHGGSMYRGPINYWTHPTREAVKTFSPVAAIKQWLHDYKFDSISKDKAMAICKKYFSKYEYFQKFYM